MDGYPLIENHGLIGDLQTAALVTTEGAVDWFCSPRFDSPSVFGALLDQQNGGHCTVRPVHRTHATKQLYLPDTAVLVTRFMTEAGAGEVVDFMPVTGTRATSRHRLVRLIRCVRGSMTFQVEIAPRFDYGRSKHELHITGHGAVFAAEDGAALTVHPIREPEDERLVDVFTDQGADLQLSLTLQAGQQRGLVLETGAEGPPAEIRLDAYERLFDETAAFWRSWLAQSRYTGRWREMVHRSAITLKLMTFAPSGAVVAAPTAALPEKLGGERNWDYRFTWIRDASFSVYALLGLGFTEEARAFIGWLADRVKERAGGTTGPLNIMYRVDGSSDLEEQILHHWEGYAGSAPVRIGNGAATQLQLDIYGEALDSIYFAQQRGIRVGYKGWTSIREDLDWLADHWDQAEQGIWETRSGSQDYTYGRVMSWVAFDRALRLAETNGWPSAAGRWQTERDAVYEQVMTKGWSEERQAFVQHYGSEVLDSSLLRMATVGFVSPEDPMWASTLDAIDRELVCDSLVYRYNPEASPDGLRGSEGTFSLCTFMYVDALVRAGRTDMARLVFEKMMGYANHLGLYSEEIDPTGRQLGNFPQAFTHLALIDAALTLDRALDRR
ncbi:glycoside hydrolase family 15 protein [Streptomyces sp. NPDC001606]